MWNRLNIRNKVLLMLLGVSLSAVCLISYLAIRSASQSLRQRALNQLVATRNGMATQLDMYFQNIRGSVKTLSQSPEVIRAMREFRAAYPPEETKLLPGDEKVLEQWYTTNFLPKMAQVSEGEPTLESYLPPRSVARYLQYYYIATNPQQDRRKLDLAADKSAYSAVHQKYHPYFRGLVEDLPFSDFYLVDAKTSNVLYTEEKGMSFATSLVNGPYAKSPLSEVVEHIQRGVDSGGVVFTDYKPHRAAFFEPTMFVAAPIYDGPVLIGVLVVRIPSGIIVGNGIPLNDVLTVKRRWNEVGLGKTGETYMVGRDYLMRSDSRFFLENPKEFLKEMTAEGVSEDKIRAMEKHQSTRLQLEVRSNAVKQALDGKSGAEEMQDYRGENVLSAYQPYDLGDTRWALLAEMDSSEALAPIRAFEGEILRWAVPLLLGVIMLSMIFARAFLKPIGELMRAATLVGSGDLTAKADVRGGDEFHSLATAFNQMTDNIRTQRNTIQRQISEKDELLRNILPGPVADQYKDGKEVIAERYANVTVLFADFPRFAELTASINAGEAATLLTDLFEAFDEAAERHGAEKVRSIGSSYLAACGLIRPRIDHTQRILDFARDLVQIVRAIEADRKVDLFFRISINTGPVEAGVIGRRRFIYDLWGETVTIARRMGDGADDYSVIVTEAVLSQSGGAMEFKPTSPLLIAGREPIPLWEALLESNSSVKEIGSSTLQREEQEA